MYQLLETPLGLRRLGGLDIAGDFSGFERENKGTVLRLVSAEREIRFMKELLESLMMKHEQIEKENKEMKDKFREHKSIIETNKEVQKELISMKEENEILKEKCVSYEAQLEDLKGKVEDDA